jgi:tRNA 2-thiouridine synthesizing protein D
MILTTGPWQHQEWETAVNIAQAALEKGHEVLIYLYLDGVYNPLKRQALEGFDTVPKDYFARLIAHGVRVIVCADASSARGLETDRGFIDGVAVGALPELADLVGEVDRLIAL